MDEANCTCKANNGDDTSKEASGSNFLDVQSPPFFLPNGQPRDITLPEGSDAIFTCVTRSLPGEKESNMPDWYRNGVLVAGSSKYQFSNNKTMLTIKDVKRPTKNPFNPRDVAVYLCSVTNGNGTAYGSGYVNVIEPIKILQSLPNALEILQGEVKSISVDATTDPELSLRYIWRFTDKDNRTLSQKEMKTPPFSDYFSFTKDMKNLTINAETLEGSQIYKVVGTYQVDVWHDYEKKTILSEVTTDVRITPPVRQPIKILQTLPETLEIFPGEVKSISVDATADPDLMLEYKWSFTNKDNRTLSQKEMRSPPCSDYFSFTTDMENLTINAETLEGSQIYTVVGTYQVDVGHEYEKTTILSKITTDIRTKPTFRQPIKILQTLPDTLEIFPGDVKSMSVDATADPGLTLEYTWSFTDKDNTTVFQNEMTSSPYSDYFSFTTDMKNLTINAETLEGSQIYTVVGTYQVVVWHDYEKKTILSEVTTDVRKKPTIRPIESETESETGTRIWIIAIIVAMIVVFIIILLTIGFCYRNRRGTYPFGKKKVNAGHDPEKELKDSELHDLSPADDFDNSDYNKVSLSSKQPIESDEDSIGYGEDLGIPKFNDED